MTLSRASILCAMEYWQLVTVEVCVPECSGREISRIFWGIIRFPGNGIREHPLPSFDSVPAFGTGVFPAYLRSGNIREFPNASRIKINNFNFGACQDFPDWYQLVFHIQHLPILSRRVPFLI